MSSDLVPHVVIRYDELPANTAATIRALRLRQWVKEVMIVFPISAFAGLGVTEIARMLFFDGITLTHSVAVGLGCGLMAMIGLLSLNWADWPLIRKDLEIGKFVEANVACEHATTVGLAGGNILAVALDCGEDTILLKGNWWLHKARTEIWDDPGSRKRFPAKRFRIQFLPQSGIVLFVQVFGGRLQVDAPAAEPLINLHFSKYAEIIHINQSFRSLGIGAN